MERITEIDNELREEISKESLGNGVYLITQKKQDETYGKYGRIVPCSPSKIRLSDVIYLKPHSRILPVGFTPMNKATAVQICKQIDGCLAEHKTTPQSDGYPMPIAGVENIIQLSYRIIKKDDDSTRFVDESEFITTLRYLAGINDNKTIPVIVRLNRNLPKYRPDGRIYDNPDTSGGHTGLAKQYANNSPVLFFLHHEGTSDGWHDRPFWWPVLISPSNTPKTMYASKIPTEKIRMRR